MSRITQAAIVIIFGILGYLGYKSHVTYKMVAENRSMLMDSYQHLTDLELMMEGFVELAPMEMEAISRKVAKEVSLGHFEQFAENLKKVGKYKDWEVMVMSEQSGKVCFAQSSPVLQAPKKNKRDARLFVTFRPSEKISNEISTTAGYEFNINNTVLATSGNNKFKFDIKQQGFAWMTSNKKEKIMVKIMKKGSRIMVAGYNQKGSQTIDHYSLLGFTKAYNTAKKACS